VSVIYRTAAGAPHVRIFEDAAALARAAAGRFVEASQAAVKASGRFSVALAGGNTPRKVYELLAGDEFGARVEWSRCHVFFGDERCVPPDHPESNYRMADETLLSRVPLPRDNVHRIEGVGDAVENAHAYEDELRSFFGDVEWPTFDLVLLGLGDDGHTASLFPHTPALDGGAAWVAANRVEKLGALRITLTAPAINQARRVLFLVSGRSKTTRLAEVVRGRFEPERLPAQSVRPLAGGLEWFVDEEAACAL
jgi:6-phosphogluconolactonase